ncbi:MAG: sensor histidine kinase [Bacteroidales bacterium]|nr:MAG: sensor histidine kinase [Bacteroidales bacterium]
MNKNKKKSIRKRILNHLLGLLLVFLISFLISYGFAGPSLLKSGHTFIVNISFGVVIGISFWKGNEFLGRYTGHKFAWSENPKKAYLKSIVILLGYGLLVGSVYPTLFYKFVLKLSIIKHLHILISLALLSVIADYIIISIFFSKKILYYWQKSIENEERLKRENIIAQYETLKNQVNPHFLFNSLNTISTLISKNLDVADMFIKQLSEVYRYVLEFKDKEVVDIKTELKFIDSYLYLQKIRFGDNLEIKNRIKTGDFYIAPLTIQILVENAIKHNVISDDKPLKIELFSQESYIVIENNLQKKKIIESKEKIGLNNIRSRYEVLSDKPVIIEESDNKFTVKIPVIYSSKYDHTSNRG